MGAVTPLSMDAFPEDWQESQFWYSDETANLYARELLECATDESTIAVVSTPSVFVALKNILNTTAAEDTTKPKPTVYLLEHDQRFALFPEFIFYDLNEPVKLPPHLKGNVDRLICDPPFLNEDTQTKTALTMRWLSKPNAESPRVIVSTGERIEPLIRKLYKSFGVRTTTYEPDHAGLKNEFLCYANFETDAWKWKEAPDQ